MKSLEFIKQHVKEWPEDGYNSLALLRSGKARFSNKDYHGANHFTDLSEHFAPDYYDGKVYTREEFESFGVAGGDKREIWYSHQNYKFLNPPCNVQTFGMLGCFKLSHVTHVADRPITEHPATTPNDGVKYETTIIGLCGTPVKIDIYRVLDAYPQVDPHIEHLIKKALKPGQRGHKDKRTDYLNIIESAQKALKLLDQKESLS